MINICDMCFHARFLWRSFFGLGFGIERSRMCDENENYKPWWALNWKLFLGPIILYGTINFRKSLKGDNNAKCQRIS